MGVSVDDLAKEMSVTKRTIWRDLEALQHAGFPLIDEKRDRKTVWKLTAMPLKALNDPALSFSEVCSLYMSRALVMSMAGPAFSAGVASVFKKLQRVLSSKMREFLDELPGVIKVKAVASKKRGAVQFDEIVARLIEGSMRRRAASVRYFSMSSNREKDYELHPYNVAYADGGLYLTAYVPEYRQVRTFAIERVRKVTLLDHGFEPATDLASEPFGHSLGVNRGRPEKIEIEFAPRVAPYIREREWHKSQELRDRPDGGVRMTLRLA
jgi:predicted DNA-binding transcriptional regulator YafY